MSITYRVVVAIQHGGQLQERESRGQEGGLAPAYVELTQPAGQATLPNLETFRLELFC